ncbi:hypothetical protein N7490_009881 [Penicillium lividum]|nr:hypothetical protein N7490_009881 [Penicillium lividum]
MSSTFTVIEHVMPGQHIREYPHSIKGKQETPLQLAIKQYIPLDRPTPIPDNAITIIGSPGNGSPKEVYEPLWEDLYTELKKQGIPLRAIWIADISNQGTSGTLNEHVQGDQTNWYDHSRDLLHMVNQFRDEMPRPIIGVAHSMGCAQLVNLSIIHPRLLSTLILFEPVILDDSFRRPGGPNPGFLSSLRRDLWPSADKAKESLSKGLRKWDPRVQELYLKYGLRKVPTAIYPDSTVGPEAVTLTTTKHQESWNYFTPNLEPENLDRLLLPDWDVTKERRYLFSRPEGWSAMRNLAFLRPSVQWVFGEKSYLSSLDSQDAKMQVTGSGVGGSGGVQAGAVEKAVLKNGSHTLVFENVKWCAETAATWIQKWFSGWLADEKFWSEYQSRHSDGEMLRLSKEAIAIAKIPTGTERGMLLKGKL